MIKFKQKHNTKWNSSGLYLFHEIFCTFSFFERIVNIINIKVLQKNKFDSCNRLLHMDGLRQNCPLSIGNALEIQQSATKPLTVHKGLNMRISQG